MQAPPRPICAGTYFLSNFGSRGIGRASAILQRRAEMPAGRFNATELGGLARDEMLCYTDVMSQDPLLPRELLPDGYRGMDAYAVHQGFVKTVVRRAR